MSKALKCSLYIDKVTPANFTSPYNMSDESNWQYLGDVYFNIPGSTAGVFWSSETRIITNGAPTSNYTTLLNNIPDLLLATSYGIAASSGFYKFNSAISALFPLFLNLYETNNNYKWLVLKFNNGYIMTGTETTSNSVTHFYDANKAHKARVVNFSCFGRFPYARFDSNNNITNLYSCALSNAQNATTSATTYASSGDTTAGITFLNSLESIPEPPADPYSGAGYSGFAGGGGRHDTTSDAINIPALPLFNASATGFMNLYKVTLTQLNALAQYMWNTLDISQLKALFTNPMEAIIGLSMIPVTPSTSADANIKLGNIDTGCEGSPISNQFVTIDCGTITIDEFWGSYLDYDPYTKAELFLPYIGTKDLDINDIMGKTVNVTYHVDVLSGACVAFVKCGNAVLYHFSGHCSVSIPVTSSGFGSLLQSAASMAWAGLEKVANALQGMPQNPFEVATSVFNAGRTRVSKSGAIGSAAGIMDTQKPYLIITRPIQSVPEDQNKYTGYPSNVTCILGDLSGYTEVETIRLQNISATGAELDELEALLKSGVIL